MRACRCENSDPFIRGMQSCMFLGHCKQTPDPGQLQCLLTASCATTMRPKHMQSLTLQCSHQCLVRSTILVQSVSSLSYTAMPSQAGCICAETPDDTLYSIQVVIGACCESGLPESPDVNSASKVRRRHSIRYTGPSVHQPPL